MEVMFLQSLWNCQRLVHSLNHNLSIAIFRKKITLIHEILLTSLQKNEVFH